MNRKIKSVPLVDVSPSFLLINSNVYQSGCSSSLSLCQTSSFLPTNQKNRQLWLHKKKCIHIGNPLRSLKHKKYQPISKRKNHWVWSYLENLSAPWPLLLNQQIGIRTEESLIFSFFPKPVIFQLDILISVENYHVTHPTLLKKKNLKRNTQHHKNIKPEKANLLYILWHRNGIHLKLSFPLHKKEP